MQSDKPMKVGDVANSFVRSLLDTAVMMGVNRQQLLDKNNISAAALEEGNRRLGLTHFMRLGFSAIKLLNEPAFGLYMGVNSNITRLGYAGFAAMTAPTLGEAFSVATRYEALTSRCYRGQSYIERTPSHFKLVFYSIAPYNEYTYFVVDAILSGWKALAEWMTGRTDLVKEIQIEFPTPFYVDKYQELLNCPVSFSQEENCVLFKPDAFDQPVIYHNPIMHRLML
ncbi:MAG TPA: AraC family transcriptional regulator, partial [Pseudomonadales bacterium]|nr:AraC family transcriptional regulator [Pseudomonadales bacterium]